MNTQAKAEFKIEKWDEKPYSEIGASKLTRASVVKSYQGDLEGEGTLEYLLLYHPDGSAAIIGFERVIGRIGNRNGSFVLQHDGTFKAGIAAGTWVVVAGSGTGELRGLRGKVAFSSGHAERYPVTLDYEFE